jgi:hypothetical protein
MAIVSLVGTGVFFYLRHHDSNSASVETANAELLRLRSRFAAQQPLLDMRERRARVEGLGARKVGALKSFHTVIFDTRGGQRLIHTTVPFWFARRYARHNGQFQWLGELTFLDDTEFDPETIQLSLDQIERHGPGLIVDYRRSSGGQFLAWVE